MYLNSSDLLERATAQGVATADGVAARDIDVAEAAQLLATMPGLRVLDVRTPVEHAEGRIAGDLNLDFYADDFADRLAALDRDEPYLIYCRCGGRSGMTLTFMQDLGFRHLIHLPAGIEGWAAAGQPVQSDL